MEQQALRPQKRRSFFEGVQENIGNKIQNLLPRKESSLQTPTMAPMAPNQPVQEEMMEETQMVSAAPVAGSSLDTSDTLTPGAAQALYTGDTDAALAAQYGAAAQGGLMTLRR